MAKVEIYTSPMCGYCRRAKRLLKSKNIDFEEYNIIYDVSRMAEMLERTGGKHTVPQIFVDAVNIGGYAELRALDTEKKLDEMLVKI